MISFRELLINAKNGDEKALMEMFDLFRPMIEKASRSVYRKMRICMTLSLWRSFRQFQNFPSISINQRIELDGG